MTRPAALTLALLPLLAGCATSMQTIPAAWLSVPQAARIGSLTLADDGTVTPKPEPAVRQLADGAFRAMGGVLMSGDKVIAEKLGVIDSVDLSESRGEVAFSARPEKDFDIGLISTDGGAVHWMPRDPADEVDVQWAPRGNKISYIIRGSGGDIVRTLHIPTAYQFAVPFPTATIHALAWEPKAERYAVAYSTLVTSDQVDLLKYNGGEPRTVIPPARRLDLEAVPFTLGSILLHPHDIRADERLPLVVWKASDYSWNDARAALFTDRRIAVVVTARVPDADFWRAAAAIKWLDPQRTYIVDGDAPSTLQPSAGQLLITADPALPAGRSHRQGNIVTVPSAVVQSFAAGFIAEQLKRNPPTNGSSR